MKYKKGDTVYIIDRDIAKKGTIYGHFDANDNVNDETVSAYFISIEDKQVVRAENRIYSSIKELGASVFRLFPEGMAFVI